MEILFYTGYPTAQLSAVKFWRDWFKLGIKGMKYMGLCLWIT